MKWIVIAIILFIGIYTYLTLHYRRPGKAYQPYADMKQRANTGKLLAAGYQRVELPIERPADGAVKPNLALPAPGGLPAELKATLVSVPLLPAEVVAANAADTLAGSEPYPIQFRCVAPDDRQQLVGAELYVKGDTIIITPNFQRLAGGLQARTSDTLANLSIPAQTLKPGSYRVTLVGENASRAWLLHVR